MLALLLGLALLAAAGLSLLPGWFNVLLLGSSLSFAASLLAFGEPGRVVAPALLLAVALGFLVRGNAYVKRPPKVAPRKRRKEAPAGPSGGLEGVEVPGYDLLEKVGSGGMASVYRAKRRSDGGTVALKIPMEQYVADAKFIRRFHREAEVAGRLDHINIVRTFEHGSVGVRHYMVMEFVDGRSLESYVESGELETGLSVEVMQLVVRALQHIHSAGIIHRDIKPANIMILRGGLSEDGRLKPDAVKLMDFGIAGGKILTRLTMTGARVGTPVYMSPEQARGLKIDHRSDIYSLGLVFYEMLTGQTAFKGGYEAIVHQQIFQTPPPPRQLNLEVPKALDALVMRMIAKEADERPPLEEIYDLLAGNFDDNFDDPNNALPSRLLLTVSARQGLLRELDTAGNLHRSMGDIGVGEGCFSAPPLSVALDPEGNLYAAVFEYRVGEGAHDMLFKLSPDGRQLFSFGPYGMKPGECLYPVSLSVAPDATLLVLDSETHLVQRFDAQGRYLNSFGGRGEGKGMFNDPRTVTAAPDGSIYVLDYGNRQVQRFNASGAYELRWAFRLGAETEGMRLLDGVAADASGNLYISDATGGKIRKVGPKGKVELSYLLEPLHGEATDSLLDLGVDHEGNLYAARRGGHLVRKYNPAGELVTTVETYAPVVGMVVNVRAGRAAPFELEGLLLE